MPAPSPAPDRLAGWRAHILDRVLRWGVVACFLPWLAGTWASVGAGLGVLAALTTLAYLVFLALAFAPGLGFNARAVGLLSICWGVGVGVVFQVGPLGAGAIWLASVPVLASFLFGMRGMVGGSAVLALTAAALVVPAMGPEGLGPPDGVGPGIRYDLPAWLATAGSMVGLAALLSLPFTVLLRRTEVALRRETEARGLLESEALRREALEQELRQAHKLEALGTFAGGVAHDFNNLLVPMLSDAEELVSRSEDDPEARRSAERILQAATRSRELVRGILAFSRREEGSRYEVEIRALLEEVASLIQVGAPEGLRVVVREEEETPPVLGDPFRIHQALVNLATNARQALPEGEGEIRLEVGPEPKGVGVRIRVTDTGAGMDAQTLERAMDPFFTTRPAGTGTGLGLSSALGVIRSMGGTLELSSIPGQGTIAEILLPAHPRGEVAAATNPPELGAETAPSPLPGRPGASGAPSLPARAEPGAPHPAGGGARILLVDDDPLVRSATRRLLERLGFLLVDAASGEEALVALRDAERAGGLPDLVLTDRTMPGMDGLALAREVRSRYPALPVILVTGNLQGAGGEGGEQATAPGLSGVLRKPFTRKELEAEIDSVLGNPMG